jgi:hypothetical protein
MSRKIVSGGERDESRLRTGKVLSGYLVSIKNEKIGDICGVSW